MRFLPLCLTALALSCAAVAHAAATRAFVVTTDFGSGGLSVVNLGDRSVAKDLEAVHSDATLRWYEGKIYVINRFGQDNVQVIDPSAGYATVLQFSTGNGSNPQDIAFASPTKAYVSRYGSASLLVVNPQTGVAAGPAISLAEFADGDGIPEMARMIRVGRHLFVALQRLAGFTPTDSSLIAVIDTQADTVVDVNPALPGRQAIRLTAANPATAFAVDAAGGRLLIGCVGQFNVLDGGIEAIDPVALQSLGIVITEAALGGDIGDVAWNVPEHSYAIVSDASFNSALVSWSAVTHAKLGTVFSPGGFSLPDCEVNDRGELYVCDNAFAAPGVFVFSTTTDLAIAGPLDTGLPPFNLVFDSADPASVAPASHSFQLAAPWPNPARREVRIALTLARESAVRVEIFDAMGRSVRTLLSATLAAGRIERTWDLRDRKGRAVEPGVFLVRARFDGREEMRRIAVMR